MKISFPRANIFLREKSSEDIAGVDIYNAYTYIYSDDDASSVCFGV